MKVGFIGMGIMGSRMAANLLLHGYELVIFNRTKDKATSLINNGAIWADTPEVVANHYYRCHFHCFYLYISSPYEGYFSSLPVEPSPAYV
ncbi:hypothetical protein NIES2101_27545 [Calothrix sp. HK-06]|nr:hypothetical protein NIES2101_27545 [Calothrix sp. HK-06]